MERRGAEPLGHSLRAQPAEGKGRQTDQHHLGEVLGDQGGLPTPRDTSMPIS